VDVLQNQEFIVGTAVAVIVLSALMASSLFRNGALALAAGAIVMLYVQSGIPGLLAISKVLESEIKAIPDFSHGLLVGLAISAVLLYGLRQRSVA
jgi:zinc transporter ZupT